jgi:hypothetical protein
VNVPPEIPAADSGRLRVRLGLLAVSGLAALYLGFFALSLRTAENAVKRGGYFFLLATAALWAGTLWRLWQARKRGAGLPWREAALAAVAIGGVTLLALAAEPFHSKILYDEFVLQSTAFNMHFFRDASTMVRGYDVFGQFVSTDNYLDKRPFFYPFLVSLVHDFTGYRPLNAYLVNAGLLPVALALVYHLGRLLAGARAALLGVLLLGSLPLLGQNATGSGMELLNLVMILAVTALAAAYLAQPDGPRLAALVIGAVLLAESRYESALYVPIVALVVVLGWWRARRIELSWPAIVAPLLLLPYAWQNNVVAHSPVQWELNANQTSRFSVEYLAGNLRGALRFFFGTSPQLANSWLLSAAGAAAGVALTVLLLRRRPRLRTMSPAALAVAAVGLGILANTALVMFYYWASLDDSMASRFSLPLQLLLALAVVAVVARASRWRWLGPALALGGVAAIFGSAVPRQAMHLYSHLGIDEIEWERRFVAARPPGDRLILTSKSSLPWLVLKTPSILISRARLVPDRLRYQLSRPTFREILVFQSLRPASVYGQHELVPEDALPPGFHLETIAEKRFGTKIDRVSRLVAVDESVPAPPGPATGTVRG